METIKRDNIFKDLHSGRKYWKKDDYVEICKKKEEKTFGCLKQGI